ncbi:MAG: cell wall hydrolase [Polymorphobacter sp.]|uniref:cell wall hydrolase n=1 Tax=Polymorphobacter sp. TaxID=1909290 RepID=UPI003A88F711
MSHTLDPASFRMPARASLLIGGIAAGLAIATVSDRVAAAPGLEDRPTTFETGPLTPIMADISAIPINLPELAPFASGPLGEVSAEDFECMARVVDHEAANQPRDGKLAVAHVLINRVRSKRFPNTLCAVAYQPKQFSYIKSHRIRENSQRWATARQIAHDALSGRAQDPSGGALFFHATYIAPNSFFRTRTPIAQLEDHIFYR